MNTLLLQASRFAKDKKSDVKRRSLIDLSRPSSKSTNRSLENVSTPEEAQKIISREMAEIIEQEMQRLVEQPA